MGRRLKKREPEGTIQTMAELTKNHEDFMKGRNSDRRVLNEDAKEKFDSLIAKSISNRTKH